MLGVLLSFLVLAGLGIVLPFFGLLNEHNYGSQLEQYITSRDPQNTSDIERYTREFEASNKGFL